VNDQEWNCRPSVANAKSADTLESILIACPLPPDEYDSHPWEKTTRGKKTSTTLLPWLEALGWSTEQLFASRRTEPPGFRYVSYLRPVKCFDPPSRSKVAVRPREVNGVLYALEGKLRPRITATLEIAEQVRRRLMGIHRNLMGGDSRKVSSKFSGKDASGEPLRGHRHAFILPQDADRDGWLDHLLVICRDNLDLDECRALDLLDRLYQRGGKPDVRCIPIRWGALSDLLKPAVRFISATPFVPPRHYRRGRGDFAEWLLAQVRREPLTAASPSLAASHPCRGYAAKERSLHGSTSAETAKTTQ
jgi:CRISPR-associated protein Csb2